MKFKEDTKQYYIDGTNNKVKIKPYYTWEEKRDIMVRLSSLGEQDNAFMRDYVKVFETAKVCTNIDFEDMEDVDIYDTCAKLGLITDFKIMIEGYDDFERFIERDRSSYYLVKEIADKLEGFMEGENTEELISKFMKSTQEAKEQIKE